MHGQISDSTFKCLISTVKPFNGLEESRKKSQTLLRVYTHTNENQGIYGIYTHTHSRVNNAIQIYCDILFHLLYFLSSLKCILLCSLR